MFTVIGPFGVIDPPALAEAVMVNCVGSCGCWVIVTVTALDAGDVIWGLELSVTLQVTEYVPSG